MSTLKSLAGLSLLAVLATAQTQVDLKTRSKGVDLQTAPHPKPLKSGATLPTSCTINKLFFLSSAPAGSNVYSCNSTNTWTLQGGRVILGGDVSGESSGAVVEKIQGLPVSSAAPISGQALAWNGTMWAAQTISTLAGDVSGPINSAVVMGLQNQAVSSAAPASGQALVWNGSAWAGQTLPGTLGTISVENANTPVGTRGVQNFVAGTGLVNAMMDTGSQIQIQQSADTAVLLTRSAFQSGQSLLCTSLSASGSTYTCALTPTLSGYQEGMVVQWRPDISASGGATTLEIDSLGAKSVKLAGGTLDPQVGDIVAGQQYAIWFDGMNFRLMDTSGITLSTGSRPTCAVALRGRVWYIFSSTGVKDDVSVCAKEATDGYAWRVLY